MKIFIYSAIPAFFSTICVSLFPIMGFDVFFLKEEVSKQIFLLIIASSQISKPLGTIISAQNIRKYLNISPIISGMSLIIASIAKSFTLNINQASLILLICRTMQGIAVGIAFPNILFVIADNCKNKAKENIIMQVTALTSAGRLIASLISSSAEPSIYIVIGMLCIASAYPRYIFSKDMLFRSKKQDLNISFKQLSGNNFFQYFVICLPFFMVSYVFNIWLRIQQRQEFTEQYIVQKFTLARIMELLIKTFISGLLIKIGSTTSIIMFPFLYLGMFNKQIITAALSYSLIISILSLNVYRNTYNTNIGQINKSFTWQLLQALIAIINALFPQQIYNNLGYFGLYIMLVLSSIITIRRNAKV